MKNYKKIVIGCLIIVILIVICFVALSKTGEHQVNYGVEMSDINKPIEEYTWDEFNSLKGPEQIKFQDSFDNETDFIEWMTRVNPEEIVEIEDETLPWEETKDAKKPEDYTWEDFNRLEADHQIKFQTSFEEEDGFEKWLEKNEPIN